MFSKHQTRQVRWGIAIGTLITYVLLFFLLYPRFREGTAALAILPVTVIAWLSGPELGLLAGILSFPLNTLLLNLAEPRANPLAVVIQSGGGPGSVAIVLIGFIIGLIHNQRVQMERELVDRQQVENALRESEQRHRALLEAAQRQEQELALFDQVRQALAREMELPIIFQTVVEGIAKTFGYTQVSLYLVDKDVLVLQHQVGYDRVIERIPLTQGVSGRVVRSQRPILLEDVRNDPAFLGAIEGIVSEVCVPLFDQGEVAGVLNVESTQGVRLSEADLRLMTALGDQIGIALGRARLYSNIQESEQRFRQLAEHIEQVFWLEDPERSHLFYLSPAFEVIWGRTRQSLYEQPQSWFDAVHPDDRERVRTAQVLKVSGEYNIEYRILRPDGSLRWIWSRAFPIQDEQGEVYRIAGIAQDITERKIAEEALQQSEERFKLMAWATKDAVWDWDLLTDRIWWGEGLQKIFHYSTPMAQTDSEWWFEHIHPEDQAKVHRTIDQALEGGMEFWSKEYRFQQKDGTFADIMDRGYIIRDDTGKPNRMIGAMIDITDRRRAEETIRHQNEMLSSLHYITLNLLRYREVNQLLNALVEFSTTFLDAPYAEIMLVEDEKLVVRAATQNQYQLIGQRVGRKDALLSWQAFDTHEPAVLSDYASWPQRQEAYNEFSLHAVADFPILSDDQCLGVLALGRDTPDYEFTTDQIQFGRFFADLTALVLNNAQLREALREQSIRDPLTGLFNRRYMEETLKREVRRVTRQLNPLGIIMIDIDHFKHFNDTQGHTAGDTLLQGLGQLLQSHIRGEDVACRYGGEEFILILPNTSVEVAQQRAENLRQEVKHLRMPVPGQSQNGITLSIGIAIYPEHGRTMAAVLRAADAALYRAKQEGRDRVVIAEKEH